jgi:hypothetical protein
VQNATPEQRSSADIRHCRQRGPAEAVDTYGDELLDVSLDGHVRPLEKHVSAGLLHEIERLACCLLVVSPIATLAPRLAKPLAGGSSDSRGGARDENRLAAEIEEIPVDDFRLPLLLDSWPELEHSHDRWVYWTIVSIGSPGRRHEAWEEPAQRFFP